MTERIVEVDMTDPEWTGGRAPLQRTENSMSKALQDIAAERQRQIEVEHWAPEHDDAHDAEELAKAAGCYALGVTRVYNHRGQRIGYSFWPWDMKWWKPTDRRRDLVKAGALIAAEIERLDRAAAT